MLWSITWEKIVCCWRSVLLKKTLKAPVLRRSPSAMASTTPFLIVVLVSFILFKHVSSNRYRVWDGLGKGWHYLCLVYKEYWKPSSNWLADEKESNSCIKKNEPGLKCYIPRFRSVGCSRVGLSLRDSTSALPEEGWKNGTFALLQSLINSFILNVDGLAKKDLPTYSEAQ